MAPFLQLQWRGKHTNSVVLLVNADPSVTSVECVTVKALDDYWFVAAERCEAAGTVVAFGPDSTVGSGLGAVGHLVFT